MKLLLLGPSALLWSWCALGFCLQIIECSNCFIYYSYFWLFMGSGFCSGEALVSWAVYYCSIVPSCASSHVPNPALSDLAPGCVNVVLSQKASWTESCCEWLSAFDVPEWSWNVLTVEMRAGSGWPAVRVTLALDNTDLKDGFSFLDVLICISFSFFFFLLVFNLKE